MAGNFDLATAWDNRWLINGQAQKRKMREYLGDSVQERLHNPTGNTCPYCKHLLKRKMHRHYDIDEDVKLIVDEPLGEPLTGQYLLHTCPRCSYWTVNGYEGGRDCMDPVFLMSAASVLAKFSAESPHGCSEELAQHLRRNPGLWHLIEPRRLETLVTDIFKANHQHCEVKHVGQPGDLGVDVLFVDDNSTRWLIQVKRRSKSGKAEGFETLQRILGSMALKGERHGIIVSTADSFSYQAKRETKNALAQGFTVQLFDKGVLDRMVGKLLPRHPWLSVFLHPDAGSMLKDLQVNFTKREGDTVGIGEIWDIGAAKGEDAVYMSKDPDQLSLFDMSTDY